MKRFLFVVLLAAPAAVRCQNKNFADTLQTTLPEVVVSAFEQNKGIKDVPAAINYVSKTQLSRINPTNIVQALNLTAGVRMEERSPGSYRLNIRGSSLRSPFGVRNVKIYYNNIPLTDPGGNTYLNQLGFYNFKSIEVLKGPGSSLYGAGTGGVMLINSDTHNNEKGVTIDYSTGSYGLQNLHASAFAGGTNSTSTIDLQRITSNGYRIHSELERTVFTYETINRLNENDKLTTLFLYGNLYYQTPGALTNDEFQKNPRSARPAVGTSPGAAEAAAAIYQKMFLAGLSNEKQFGSGWKNTTSLYAAFSKLDNPAIRNYARNNQPHFGGRSFFEYKKTIATGEFSWLLGGELQQSFNTAKVYRNRGGQTDSLQTDDELNIKNYFVFTQGSYAIKKWMFSGGISLNKASITFSRFSKVPPTKTILNFGSQFAPRLSALYKITPYLSAYGVWSQGFSPPTADELFPTGSLANPTLSAERGTNYEAGLKGYAIPRKLSFDVSAFYYRLYNAVVQRRDAAGGDYYTNAGSTRQMGIETQVNWSILPAANKQLLLWLSYSFYRFNYRDFKQVSADYSGNKLPGVPKHYFSAGIDYNPVGNLFLSVINQYSGSVALNDANTAMANAVDLLSAKARFKTDFKWLAIEYFIGADNITNRHYSLGYDINAFGGRYYNAAPGRSYYGGISFNLAKRPSGAK